ncbi:hypothetical protein SH2C18_20590 [Clostridium sediminicola]|uniref:hypothetical protein n=1 Tax=Clostridium sediminicola TaxID=3114879 RepID=UPI0031F1D862
MDNHVHLMIETDTEPLGKLIGRRSASYTYLNPVRANIFEKPEEYISPCYHIKIYYFSFDQKES